MNSIAGSFLDVATGALKVLLTTVFVALVFNAMRALLRHQLGLWASRDTPKAPTTIERNPINVEQESARLYDYRFIIDNLEPVPLDLPLTIVLDEESFPNIPRPLFPAAAQEEVEADGGYTTTSDGEFQESLRIYSGVSKPTFVYSGPAPDGSSARSSSIRFNGLRAYDTWTIRLRSLGDSVTLRVVPAGVALSRINPLRPWLAITTSVSAITISQDGTLGRGGKFQPSWTSAFWTAAISPAFYALARWLLLPVLLPQARYDLKGGSWLDACALILLVVMGVLWFLWIRRPIYPAIQGYRGFRTANSQDLVFDTNSRSN
jgi:hypothetical protein